MLTVYTLAQAEKWDAVVRSFQSHDVYWLSGYVKAFQIHGDGEPLLFYYEDETVRGINVVMKRDVANDPHFSGKLPENTYFDLATPYGYGGWLIEGADCTALMEAYARKCREEGYICEFVRFHPVLKNYAPCRDAYEVIPLGNTVALDLSSPECIWENITSKNRNMIRKAQKSGIEIRHGRSAELFETFRGIYNATMDKDNAAAYYYFGREFYESILSDLPENARIFYAVLEDKIIAASIMLAEGERLNYHLSGSVREFSNLAPSNLLLYQAALWGCENGCKTFHLGGGVGGGEDSLFKFKKSFYRKEDLPLFCIGKKIFCPEKYEELLTMRGGVESSFFPKYRA